MLELVEEPLYDVVYVAMSIKCKDKYSLVRAVRDEAYY